MKRLRRLLVLALFAAAFVAAYRLAGANGDAITVDLLFLRTPPTELWIALVAAFGLGAIVAAAFLMLDLARLGLLTRRYRKTVSGLESEIHQLRNLPIAEGEETPAPLAGGGAPGLRG